MADRGPITSYLERLREGDDQALDELIPLVYRELRALAQSQLNFERTDHTLSARTSLLRRADGRGDRGAPARRSATDSLPRRARTTKNC